MAISRNFRLSPSDFAFLWEDSIIAAFEIESTTSIYSGLLRMADLVAMQPNINIPLFLIAPDDRRGKVISEVNRPAFTRLRLRDRCRYVPFSSVQRLIEQTGITARYTDPRILEEFSESCEPD